MAAGCAWGAQWQAGAASVDISPREPIWLAGYAARTRPSESVREPIHTKALALRDEAGKLFVAVTIDLVGIRREITDPVAARAARELQIPRERILFNVSHTHSAPLVGDTTVYEPIMGAYAERQKAAVARYTEALPGLMFRAISEAVANLKPAEIAFGQGSAGIAVNRRHAANRSLPGPVDQDAPVLTAKTPDGRWIAILFGYACHNTSMDDYTVHGDYAGFAQRELERRFPGAVALFVQGAGADANPLPRGNNELRERHGATLADAVGQVIAGGKMQPVRGAVSAAIEFPELAFQGPFDRARWETEMKSTTPMVVAHGKRMLAMLDSGGKLPDKRTYVVEAWRFGDALTLLALGSELTVDYALRFKAQYGADTTWVAGYSNETFGYIPSRRVWNEGGYEGGDAFRFSTFPGRFTPDVEDRITAAVERVMSAVRR
jgi:neutral ceramidase